MGKAQGEDEAILKLFLSPHSDDETLFGSFTIMRERPVVCVVFDSHVQPLRGFDGCDRHTRRMETCEALFHLKGDSEAVFLGFRDDKAVLEDEIAQSLYTLYAGKVDHVWAPAPERGGHDQHNAVGLAANLAFPGLVSYYLTYTRDKGKSRQGYEVQPRSGDDIARKLRALACYTSQLEMNPKLGCWPHFVNDLREYAL